MMWTLVISNFKKESEDYAINLYTSNLEIYGLCLKL